jgi:chemotaxis family two-component system response regulator Rcp1
VNILVVEDNKSEQEIIQEAFLQSGSTCDLYMTNDGVEALQFLNHEGEFQSAPKPNLIILDLNLPRKNGREVLAEIKRDPQKANIPVIIFSNSDTAKDICDCYSLKANAYLTKPYDFEELVDLVKLIDGFWVKSVQYCNSRSL